MTNINELPEAKPGVGIPFIPPQHPKVVMSPADLIEYYDNLQSQESEQIQEP